MSKIRLFVCSWHRKPCSEAERFSVTTGAQEVYKNPPQRPSLPSVKPPRQFQPYVIQRQLLRGFRSTLRQEEMLCCFCQRMLHIVLKSKTVQQVFTLSVADCIKGSVKFFVRFLGNINLCGIGHVGIRDKGMTIPIFKFRHFVQTDDLAHVLCFKRCTLTSDVVDHGIADCWSCVCQKFVAAIGIEFFHAPHQSQTAFLHKIVKGNAECPIDFYLCAPYLMRCHSYKSQIVFYQMVQRIHVSGLRQRTQFLVINLRHVLLLLA